MFSGIHSLFFGKKHHHDKDVRSADDSAVDKASSSNSDGNIQERRHSDETDVNLLYPKIDPTFPSTGNLPYGVSPSLPDLRPEADVFQKSGNTRPVDVLHGVPFQLASHIDITSEKDESVTKILERLKDQLSEDEITDRFSYDFELENRILSEFVF